MTKAKPHSSEADPQVSRPAAAPSTMEERAVFEHHIGPWEAASFQERESFLFGFRAALSTARREQDAGGAGFKAGYQKGWDDREADILERCEHVGVPPLNFASRPDQEAGRAGELVGDLKRRAQACREALDRDDLSPPGAETRGRLLGKAQAYDHAAELVATLSERP